MKFFVHLVIFGKNMNRNIDNFFVEIIVKLCHFLILLWIMWGVN